MKKGASHVDWAIGTGLFVVFIMLTLTFLRPGTEPIYKGDVLLKIIEDRLKNDTYYTIEKQFLMIEPTSISTGEYKTRIRNPISNGLNPDWKTNKEHLGLVNSSLGTVPSEELLYTPYDLDDEYCSINCPAQCSPACLPGCPPSCPGVCCGCCEKDVLDINTKVINNEKNVFWFLYSDENSPAQQDVDIGFKSDPKEGCFGTGTCLLDGENFTYKFGVSETLKGFSEEKLIDSFKNKNYKSVGDLKGLKDLWKIPADKEFRINITNLTTCTPSSYTTLTYDDCLNLFNGYPIEEQIPPGVSVFVKEWKDWVLTFKGGIIPIEVHIELW